jgi:hypothetical protein
MTSIVQVNVRQQVGPAPNYFQRTGAMVSIGATTLAPNASVLITQPSDLTSYLANAISISSATWASSTVTITTSAPHGYSTGDSVTIYGYSTGYTGYNGTFTITVTGTTTFTYAEVTSLTTPAVGTAVATDADVAELIAMVGTYFAQGNGVPAVYVLELGHGTQTAAVAALAAYLTANPPSAYNPATPGVFYRYLVPRGFDAQATFVSLVAEYTSPTAQQYFHVTCTLSTYPSFTATNGKAVISMIEAPTIPATEFTSAAGFAVALGYNPSSTNQVTPYCFSFLYAVTAYPITPTLATQFATANLNYVTTGAEGGISNLMLVNGTQEDGNPLNYWYSVDYTQIQVNLNISNAVINGSNNPQAPLYYNQEGINTLQSVGVKTGNNIVAVGLAIGPVYQYQMTDAQWTAFLESGQAPIGWLFNAVPFASYVALNPSDYPVGKYQGLSVSYTPQRGFQNIVFNVVVSNFVA